MIKNHQIKMFDIEGTPPLENVINVASVPKRSPFRYPGGKTWLIPTVRNWLKQSQ
jgi:DNA adenine methylase